VPTGSSWLVWLKDKSASSTEQAYGGLSHTRIEYHYTTNKPFLELNTLKNPFNKISLAYPKAPKGVKPYARTFFIDSCVRRGQDAALAMLPDGKLRNSYQKSLDAAHVSFWRPGKIATRVSGRRCWIASAAPRTARRAAAMGI
jgi:hypothetical protein